MELEYKRCFFENGTDLSQLVDLQNEVYKERGLRFTDEVFRFWYLSNPEGKAISYNAFDNGVMVAHQSFIPEKMLVDGNVVRCLRSMAVVTHPDYRGRGVFSELTNAAVEEAKRQGFSFIYAVTNENSFPPFIKHCGFNFVTRLNVKIGFCGSIQKDGKKVFQRYWTKDTLEWRLSYNNYFRSGKAIYGTYRPGVRTFMGVLDEGMIGKFKGLEEKRTLCPTLYVGLGAKLPYTLFNVPKFIKHSPFNLIYKDLTGGKVPVMTRDNVFYQLVDFDVV